ncbi:hypothetical protein GCM10009570_04710 [Dietzia natronolimnaea]
MEESSRLWWNHLVGRGVKQIVGTLRGPAAALAACAVMSACGVSQDNDQAATTSPAAAEETINPWDLPIEQRPALFDPCAEIPIEAVEQGVGESVEAVEEFSRNDTRDLVSCGWKTREIHFVLLATWKSKDNYLSDPAFVVIDEQADPNGRRILRLTETGDDASRTCTQLYFTSRGTFWASLDLVTALREFKGRRFANACEVLAGAIGPILVYIPEGDYR